MSSDPRLQAAISHWGARFVANGVALTDFEDVTRSLASYDDWCRAWSDKRRRARGRWAARRSRAKKFISAGEHLQRAGVYYHFGKFLFVQDHAADEGRAHERRSNAASARCRICDRRASASRSPIEGKTLYGILRKPRGVEKPPVLVMAVGLDSAKEETDAYEQPFLARGIATLAFDGPGQGEGEYDFAIRGDYEVAGEGRGRLRRDARRSRQVAHRHVGRQPRRLLRAARRGVREAHQGLHRARRAVRLGRDWDGLPELTREAFRVRSHCATDAPTRSACHDAVAQGRGAEHHLSDFHHERQARPLVPASTPSGWRAR